MISRALLDLATRGYGFPKQDALRINREYRLPAFPTVRVRVLMRHYQLRRLVEPGEIVQLDEPTAIDAIALGRAERI